MLAPVLTLSGLPPHGVFVGRQSPLAKVAMLTPFEVRPLRKPGFFRRLFRRPVSANSYIELENLLATQNWSEIHQNDVARIITKHGGKKIKSEIAKQMFAKAVQGFVNDNILTEDEISGMHQLRDLLGMRDRDVREIEQRIIHPQYHKALTDVFRDESVSDAENEALMNLRKALRMDERVAREMWDQTAQKIFDRRVQLAVGDQRLDSDELSALDALAKNFRMSVDTGSANHALLGRFRWLWLMENGTFPEVAAPISLQRKEICHFSCATTLFEMRTETVRTNYHGPSARIRIMKGVYYRVGSVQAQRVTRDILREIDHGTLYVTNKRIIFDGGRKNTVIRLANVLAITPYSDAVEIEKTSGRNPIFAISDPEWLGVLLSSLLAQSSE